ncbi:MAG: GNAT family N-acetyltransferase [Bacteroidetes bacterium]|nr:GNAT family N-acetyltransferase [Bacteroidota bacterium]
MNQSLKWTVKKFEELTLVELYDLLALRAEVFVVEQNCVYQDVDGKDDKALHVLAKENDTLLAYTRIFKPGDYFKEASIGRVVVSPHLRGRKLGYDLMKKSIEAVETHFKTTSIHISAQCYLIDFYKNLGFKPQGESYLEDDIPHIAMFFEK